MNQNKTTHVILVDTLIAKTQGHLIFSFDNVSGIIFDLDDTLVQTQLNFAAIKKDIACPHDADILTFVETIGCMETKAKAHQIILEHELDDALSSTWMPGAENFVQQARAKQLPLAIVTRNCKAATNTKIDKNKIDIELVVTREDAPPKPDPSALLQIAEQWQLPCEELAYIGDYKYDIFAAHNANMQAWLYTNCAESNKFEDCLRFISKNNLLFQQA
ncbi:MULTISPECIES: HAD-IA family hydrolase [Alteromonadaceae]|uniref:HAD-IA family hydrolase n=1 Tax=Brumicola blandensis TaxID=3075611 RepID=A0AAW8R0J5_9ALTE|nr:MULTISPECIES: HAD-IA family hydrolase [unclassified Alteromonas]MDT0582259.1 HAD-IA family hydrolase [Alteromonas sp. W409]MDT0627785.1 HAD-IA family hydrolase [Alteromonas sp. W364]